MPIEFDRITSATSVKLGYIADQSPGTDHESFHFVLNNAVVKDNRIPPYGFSYDEARIRNALPVPEAQYGTPDPDSRYNHWDEFALNPPSGAVHATIELVYQPTSWEYIQFLWLANNGQNTFLANEGVNLLDAWLNTGMADYYVMASTTWRAAPKPDIQANGSDGTVIIAPGDNLSVRISLDAGSKLGENADWWILAQLPSGSWYHYMETDGWKYHIVFVPKYCKKKLYGKFRN